jgi:hypothetical protein
MENENIYIPNQDDVKQKLIDLTLEVEEELNKEEIDKEKIFKLRYQQMIQGLYLQYPNNNN